MGTAGLHSISLFSVRQHVKPQKIVSPSRDSRPGRGRWGKGARRRQSDPLPRFRPTSCKPKRAVERAICVSARMPFSFFFLFVAGREREEREGRASADSSTTYMLLSGRRPCGLAVLGAHGHQVDACPCTPGKHNAFFACPRAATPTSSDHLIHRPPTTHFLSKKRKMTAGICGSTHDMARRG